VAYTFFARKTFCESACENLDAISPCSALGCAFAANSAVQQEIVVAAIMIAISIFTRFSCTRSIEAV